MQNANDVRHLPAFIEKMKKAGLPAIIFETFTQYYHKVVAGQTGLIRDADILPVKPGDVIKADHIASYVDTGRRALTSSAIIKLNGGLGTSMGLTTAKSLLPVKGRQTFLDITIKQAQTCGATLALMNSFSTHEDTLAAIAAIRPARKPACFLQHKFPKILRTDLSPALWPANPDLEWNPPGHGDIFAALHASGMLQKLLKSGIYYAFISNSDNLGATLDEALLGYFVDNKLPFMMEVARRTPMDVKGGHLAMERQSGRLILRESAQCPEEELNAFRNIEVYGYFNTNNIWVDLRFLSAYIQSHTTVELPMILNPKTLDPRDDTSPGVFQVEAAMGAAISLFKGATVIEVPRSRFFPVKKCTDLLTVRSDCFVHTRDFKLILNPELEDRLPIVILDSRYYGKVDDLDARFPDGAPSLKDCRSLTVAGNILFESDVKIRGSVMITNPREAQARIPRGTVIESDVVL